MAETWSLVFLGISIVGSTYIEPLQRRGLLSASYLIDPRFVGREGKKKNLTHFFGSFLVLRLCGH